MSQLPEYIQIRAPAGTAEALREAASREGKRPAQIIREALVARLATVGEKPTDMATDLALTGHQPIKRAA